jgi:hypothetical protein
MEENHEHRSPPVRLAGTRSWIGSWAHNRRPAFAGADEDAVAKNVEAFRAAQAAGMPMESLRCAPKN